MGTLAGVLRVWVGCRGGKQREPRGAPGAGLRRGGIDPVFSKRLMTRVVIVCRVTLLWLTTAVSTSTAQQKPRPAAGSCAGKPLAERVPELLKTHPEYSGHFLVEGSDEVERHPQRL